MSSPPQWLHDLANAIATRIVPMEVLSPIGCHYCRVDDGWEITLFAADTEIVGGEKDGVHRSSRFTLDMRSLTDMFSQVQQFTWQALTLGPEDELGPHVSIDGTFQGHNVWVRVLARAPRRFHSGRRANVHELAWEEMW